jgi:hypothetical protein
LPVPPPLVGCVVVVVVVVVGGAVVVVVVGGAVVVVVATVGATTFDDGLLRVPEVPELLGVKSATVAFELELPDPEPVLPCAGVVGGVVPAADEPPEPLPELPEPPAPPLMKLGKLDGPCEPAPVAAR